MMEERKGRTRETTEKKEGSKEEQHTGSSVGLHKVVQKLLSLFIHVGSSSVEYRSQL